MKKPSKPTMDLKRPMSWSSISSFDWDPEQWYQKYVLKNEQWPTAEMLFGSAIGKRIAEDTAFLPELQRYPIFEHEMKPKFDGIPLIGFADGWDPDTLTLGEYKTGKKPWDQKRADDHGQIDMYLLMLYLIDKVRPEDVKAQLHWLPTLQESDFSIQFVQPFKIHTFNTKRTMVDVLQFGSRIKKTRAAMIAYCENHP